MSIFTLGLFTCLAALCAWLAWGAVASERRAAPRRIRRDNDRTADQLFRDWGRHD